MTEDHGRALREPALLASLPEPASGLVPTGDDPARDDMPPKMRKFLAKPPRHLAEEAVSARANKCIRKGGRPKGWLEECCESQHWRCTYCGKSMRRKARKDKPWLTATLDHVLPISRGGRNQRWNLVAACFGCNQAKGSMTADEFRATRDRDGSGEAGETGTGSTEGNSPGPQDIAR